MISVTPFFAEGARRVALVPAGKFPARAISDGGNQLNLCHINLPNWGLLRLARRQNRRLHQPIRKECEDSTSDHRAFQLPRRRRT